MIHFKPVIDENTPSEAVFEAVENDAVGGKCHLILKDNKAIVDEISFDKDKPYLVEGLLKSAYNYAALKNYYMGYCECPDIAVFLRHMNFNFDNGVYFNDIPSILQGNCCKCKDNI